jgi:hypothetical protein
VVSSRYRRRVDSSAQPTRRGWIFGVVVVVLAIAFTVALYVARQQEDPGVYATTSAAANDLSTRRYGIGGPSFFDVQDAVARNSPSDRYGRVDLVVNQVDEVHYEVTDAHGRHPACITITVSGDLLEPDVYVSANDGSCSPTA